jgi:hypothetical protein
VGVVADTEFVASGTEKLTKGRLLGRFFASSREKLREIAERLKVRHLVNLA